MTATGHKIINGVLFQATWFSCILLQWWLALIPALALTLHFVMHKGAPMARLTALWPLLLAGIGADALLAWLEVYQFPADKASPSLLGLPLFLWVLWWGFALTIPVSLSVFMQKPPVFILLCAISAPLSYRAGDYLGAVILAPNWPYYLVPVWILLALIALRGHPPQKES